MKLWPGSFLPHRIALLGGAALVFVPSLARGEPSTDECVDAASQGQVARDEGRYAEARQKFALCLSTSCPAVVRHDCYRWNVELAERQPTIALAAEDAAGNDVADVRVTLDGTLLRDRLDGLPIPVDPGEHVFRFESRAGRAEARVVVTAAERARVLRVRLVRAAAPPPPPSPVKQEGARLPLPALLLGGAGLASIGVSTAIGLSARSDLDQLESSPCAATRSCAASDVESVERRFAVADVTLALGAVALAAAIVWGTVSFVSARR